MKGTIISVILGFISLWSLNHKVFEHFFKIKRQRIYKSSTGENIGIKNTDNIKTTKVKKRNRPLK